MSAVRAAKNVSTNQAASAAESQAMQDVLYDILATGIDMDQTDVPIDEIEMFLFENARGAKSREEFRAFFAKHGLSLRTGFPQGPVGLALPPIERGSDQEAPLATLPVELAVTSFERAHAVARPLLPPAMPAVFAARASRISIGSVALWLALACLTAGLGVVATRGDETIAALRAEVQRTQQQGQRDRDTLEAMRDDAAYLESSVAATGELVQHMDEKSDLVLETLLANPRKPARSSRKPPVSPVSQGAVGAISGN